MSGTSIEVRTYKGVVISFDQGRGEFQAVVGGKFTRKPSLTAMQNAIDRAAKKQFKPFEALAWPGWQTKRKNRHGLVKVTVLGVVKYRSRYSRSSHVFVLPEKDRHVGELSKLYVDSVENVAAIKAVERYKKETERIESERRKELGRLQGLVQWYEADKYA